MIERQYATPIVIQQGICTPLHRVEFADDFHDEDWIQQLLFDHPELIPFEELEPAFKGSVCVAREVNVGAGPMDLLCINADGLITIVETKLWRNPQSRREVVSQLIDYAAELATKSYEDLADAVRDSADTTGEPLTARLRGAGYTFDAQRFHDAVSRNLSRGRFMLLAIGDGIQEGVETMADFLQGQPHLGFTLRLVEMALFRADAASNEFLFVQPRIVARTREVVRAVIEFKGENRISVSTPPEPAEPSGGRSTITADEFYRQLGENVSPAEIEFVRRALRQAGDHHLTVDWKQSGPLLKHFIEGKDIFFTLGGFDRTGTFAHTSRFYERCGQHELPEAIATGYLDDIVRLIPGASRKHSRTKGGNEWEELQYTDDAEPLRSLMSAEAAWWVAIDTALRRVDQALSSR